MHRLTLIDESIAERVRAISEATPSWPCGAGCDDCCKRLHEMPSLSRAEWERLQHALAELNLERRTRIERRVAAISEGSASKRECPLLLDGLCSVYQARPTPCRSYGYYADREAILGCERILEMDPEAVVWGNHEALQRQLDEFGEVRSLLQWWSATT